MSGPRVLGSIAIFVLAAAVFAAVTAPPRGTHAVGLALAQEWARANGIVGHVQCRADMRSVWICDVVPIDTRPALTLACYELSDPPRCDITRAP